MDRNKDRNKDRNSKDRNKDRNSKDRNKTSPCPMPHACSPPYSCSTLPPAGLRPAPTLGPHG